jgi:hypothetical protein
MRKKNKSGRRRRRRRRRRKRRPGRTTRADIIRKRSLSRRRRGRTIIIIDINIIKITRLMFEPQAGRALLNRLFSIPPIILSLSSHDSSIIISIR